MTTQRIIMAGGGDAEDSILLDRLFAQWSAGGRTLYLPIAMDGVRHRYDQCLEWFGSVFAPLGLQAVEMWTDLAPERIASLTAFRSIYIGGGNTFRLLQQIRQTGYDAALIEFARRGGCLYGGSAGAILLGHDIATCAHMDANDAGVTDLRGLDLAMGRSIWCHYTPADEHRIAGYRETHGEPVWAIPERSGIVIEPGSVRVVGTASVVVFGDDGRTVIASGEAIPT